MSLKFSPEARREWNKGLARSGECASYEEVYEFLTVYTRGLSDTTRASDAGYIKSSLALLLIAYRFPSASIVPDLIIWQHVKTFSQSQSRNAMRLLGRSKFASTACDRVTYIEMPEPIAL